MLGILVCFEELKVLVNVRVFSNGGITNMQRYDTILEQNIGTQWESWQREFAAFSTADFTGIYFFMRCSFNFKRWREDILVDPT